MCEAINAPNEIKMEDVVKQRECLEGHEEYKDQIIEKV